MQKLMTFLATWLVLLMMSLWTSANAAALKTDGLGNAASATDLSARRYYRHYHRGWYRRPYYYGYYGPGPYYYPYRPYYYRPYYAPPPFPFFPFF